jgi:hypothetical protein
MIAHGGMAHELARQVRAFSKSGLSAIVVDSRSRACAAQKRRVLCGHRLGRSLALPIIHRIGGNRKVRGLENGAIQNLQICVPSNYATDHSIKRHLHCFNPRPHTATPGMKSELTPLRYFRHQTRATDITACLPKSFRRNFAHVFNPRTFPAYETLE